MKIVVIGAGPAGMFAAIHAKNSDNEVLVIERNEKVGKKLFITGKGRCNLTNSAKPEQFMEQILRNPRFMFSSLSAYSNQNLMAFFENEQVALKVERGGRVFPNSDKSSDVIKLLEKKLIQLGIEVRLNTTVRSITKPNALFHIDTGKEIIAADRVIVATGGMSYPKTGSTGIGYQIGSSFGHEIIPLRPSLVAFETRDLENVQLTGVSLKNVELRVFENKTLRHSAFGEMLFSHYGISGPIVLTLSAMINPTKVTSMELDLKPAMTMKELDEKIVKMIHQNDKKDVINALDRLTIRRLIPILLKRSDINPHQSAAQITKDERCRLVETIKKYKISFCRLRPIEEAIITRGGMSTKQLNPKTMESKLVKDLFFCGEVIDVDALTGGYNLQIAFSTGYTAGKSAGEK